MYRFNVSRFFLYVLSLFLLTLIKRGIGKVVSSWTVAHQAPLSMGFSRQEYWSGLPCPPPGDLPNPGIETRSFAVQAGSLPSEPPGKHKNTRVGNLSLLQEIFLTQESNWDLLHCRWILYQLSYERSPGIDQFIVENKLKPYELSLQMQMS